MGEFISGWLQAGSGSSQPTRVLNNFTHGHRTDATTTNYSSEKNTNTEYLDKMDREPRHKAIASVHIVWGRLKNLQETLSAWRCRAGTQGPRCSQRKLVYEASPGRTHRSGLDRAVWKPFPCLAGLQLPPVPWWGEDADEYWKSQNSLGSSLE